MCQLVLTGALVWDFRNHLFTLLLTSYLGNSILLRERDSCPSAHNCSVCVCVRGGAINAA